LIIVRQMKNFRIIPVFVTLVILSCFTTVSGSDRFKQLSINNGLAHADANCIAQDSTGIIWIGTYAGLQSFDGYSLTHYDYYLSGQKIYKSHNRIRTLVCAGRYLWVGTESGLACFDVKDCRYVGFRVEGSPDGILGEAVLKLGLEPGSGLMMIKTESGCVLASVKDRAIRILPWRSDEERISAERLGTFAGTDGAVWGCGDRVLMRIVEKGGQASVAAAFHADELALGGETIGGMSFRNDTLCLRTGVSFHRYLVKGGKPHKDASLHLEGELEDLRSSERFPFTVSPEGDLWCGSNRDVVEIKYPFSGHPVCRRYLGDDGTDDMFVLRPSAFFVDIYNNVWITTRSRGVYYGSLSDSFLSTVSYDDFRRSGLYGSEVLSVCEHPDGSVYMLAGYRNLLRYFPATGKMERIVLHGIGNLFLQSLALGREGHIFIGSSNGIFVHETSTGRTYPLSTGNASYDALLKTSISYMQLDGKNRLWVSTWGRGLFCIGQPEDAPRVAFRIGSDTDPGTLSDRVGAFIIREDRVLLCTDNGLNRIRLNADGGVRHVSSYRADSSVASPMSTNYLAAIDAVSDSVYWVGTIGGGLNRLVIRSDKDNDYEAKVYTMDDGLLDNDCEIVMLDRKGRVWIGGNHISCLYPETGHIDAYGGGTENKAFKIYVFCKGRSGRMYMGGLYGLTYFDSDVDYLKKDMPSHLVFTELAVNNRRIMPGKEYGGRIVLEHSLSDTRRVSLGHRQNNFSVAFSILNAGSAPQVIYRYRLDGMDRGWNVLSYGQNKVYFSSLAYGSYKLQVQYSSDNGATWNGSPVELSIRMLPPWWLTLWMKLLYVALVVAGIVYVLRHYLREQKLKQDNEIQKILLAQDDEKYQAKIRFFMNASHELKTPLTLIMLSAEKMSSRENHSKDTDMILHQTKRMLTLIAELTDFRKTDLGISTLSLESVNMSEILESLYADISVWAENKKIHISCSRDEADIVTDADREKICKLVINLLSNAIKYTGEGGSIEVSLHRGRREEVPVRYPVSYTEGEMRPGTDACILAVADTGVGISADSIRRIYERFFQVAETSRDHLGSGIGLAIVKNIVLQHKGVITVSSERGRGTEFIVALPVVNNCAAEKRRESAGFDFSTFIKENYSELPELEEEAAPADGTAGEEAPVMLLVEDNRELSAVLEEYFSGTYNVHVAFNGLEGLKKCGELFPDIIVTDVMMPEMDGVEMCRRIKDNLSTACIPLVMLTAKDNLESQIEGYGSGADLYLSKPFSMRLLDVNLKRLLKQKERIVKSGTVRAVAATGEAEAVATPEVTERPAEEQSRRSPEEQERQKLVTRLKEIIETHIQETDLSPDFIASELGLSRSALYSKVKRVDGMSLADYVRNRRLEKAAELLLTTVLTVQEVIMETGFTNASHFSKVFRMKYGVSPFEYRHGKMADEAC